MVCALALTFSLVCAGVKTAANGIVTTISGLSSCPIYSVETENNAPLVSMGINCAWENDDIPTILDTLDKYNVKATFFIVGDFCDRYPETVKEIYERGHEIGNHSDTHPDMPSLSKEEIIAEIENCSDKLKSVTGVKPTLFRCPSGAYNELVINTANELGYSCIQWDCDSLDWKSLPPDEMLERIMKNLNCGSIMLFHNGTEHTAEALGQIIESVQSKGYTFVKVSELIYYDNYTIDHAGRQHKVVD